jgi:hypothetical protein
MIPPQKKAHFSKKMSFFYFNQYDSQPSSTA